MRNGALMTGRKTCNSKPVDMRGVQLVPATGFRYCAKAGIVEPGAPGVCPPMQFKPMSNAGQPKDVLLIKSSWDALTFNWDVRMIGSTPKSTKGAIATGPAMVIRYSALVTILKSPPGNTI